MIKLCKDCRYSKEGYKYFWCEHPGFGVEIDSGKPKSTTCKSVRNRIDLCGESAKWFDPKPSLKEKIWHILKLH